MYNSCKQFLPMSSRGADSTEARSRMKKTGLLVGLTAVLLLAAASTAAAQYYAFGKNKVQYENFDWLTLKGEHVEVFYYPQEEPIARLALILAEESYQDLAAKFQHDVPRMVPLIV